MLYHDECLQSGVVYVNRRSIEYLLDFEHITVAQAKQLDKFLEDTFGDQINVMNRPSEPYVHDDEFVVTFKYWFDVHARIWCSRSNELPDFHVRAATQEDMRALSMHGAHQLFKNEAIQYENIVFYFIDKYFLRNEEM